MHPCRHLRALQRRERPRMCLIIAHALLTTYQLPQSMSSRCCEETGACVKPCSVGAGMGDMEEHT